VTRDETYEEALAKIRSALEEEPTLYGALRRTVQVLRQSFDHYTWVGVYLLEGDELVLAAWSGPQATEHQRILVGQGICGLAAREGRIVNVPDVTKDSRYLMCFPSTMSEIVVPMIGPSGVLGEIDVDSDLPAAFSRRDEGFLQAVAGELTSVLASRGR
jgi:GAF domain-containing protein